MATREIAPGVYSVGVADWTLRDFHGFVTNRGVTYNSYLIVDDKIALIDTVKHNLVDELLHNVAGIVEPSKIDYIISNHAEPDHSSGLPQVIRAMPQAQVLCTAKCRDAFNGYYKADWQYKIVKTGDTLSLGKRQLHFVATPMVHWPDSMVTYLPAEKILFSMDAFGQHLANTQRFDDELPLDIIMDEARRYYANIITPLGALVLKTLDAASALDIQTIAPSHGVMWRKNIPVIVQAYKKWASLTSDPRVAILYDSMWASTERMARAILDGVVSAGAEARLIHLRTNGLTEAAAEILEAAAIAVGTPTLHNRPMPEVAAFLSYAQGLCPVAPGKDDARGKGRTALAFGSHGWSGGGAKIAEEALSQIGYQIAQPVICCLYRPDQGTLDTCRQAGAHLAEKARGLADKQGAN